MKRFVLVLILIVNFYSILHHLSDFVHRNTKEKRQTDGQTLSGRNNEGMLWR